MQDRFGRQIEKTSTVNGNDYYSVGGTFTIGAPAGTSTLAVINAANGMAPADWTPPPSTEIAPFDFFHCFTKPEKDAILSSNDINVKEAIAELGMITTKVDLTLEKTQQLVWYLVQQGLLAADRAPQVLAGDVLDS